MNQLEKLEAQERELEAAMFGNPKADDQKVEDAPLEDQKAKATGPTMEVEGTSAKVDTPVAPMSPKTEDDSTELAKVQKRFNNYKAAGDLKLSNLRREVADLSSKLAQAMERNRVLAEKLETKEPENFDVFRDEDEKVFGKEALETLRKRDAERYERMVKPIKEAEKARELERIKNLKDKAAADVQSREELFRAKLTDIRPNWEAELKDPKFLQFIQTEDEFGVKYIDTFKLAENRHHFGIIKNIYATFDALNAPKSNPEIDQHLAPRQAEGSKAVTKSEGFVITQEFIDKFNSDARKGLHNKDAKTFAWSQEMSQKIDDWYDANINGAIR